MAVAQIGAAHDAMFGTFFLHDLAVASTLGALVMGEGAVFQSAHGEVLPQEHVQGGVDGLQHTVADEDDGIEAIENHADLDGGVPAVVAAGREKGCVEAMTTAAAHGIEQRGPVPAVWRRRRRRAFTGLEGAFAGGDVEIGGSDAAVLVAFEMVEVAMAFALIQAEEGRTGGRLTPLIRVTGEYDRYGESRERMD